MTTEEKKNLMIFGGVVGGMLLITTIIWAAATFWPSKKNDQLAQASPSPIASTKPSPSLKPSPTPVVIEMSPVPTPKPSPSVKPSLSPSPSASPKPTVSPSPQPTTSPSPSVSPSPSADIDLHLSRACIKTGDSTGYCFGQYVNKTEFPSGGNYSLEEFTVRNNGHQAAINVEVKAIINGETKEVMTIDKIDPGTEVNKKFSKSLSNTIGHYEGKYQANPDKKIGESRYDNNEVSFSYDIK